MMLRMLNRPFLFTPSQQVREAKKTFPDDLEKHELIEHLKNVQQNIEYNSFYALYYDKGYYVGRIDRTRCKVDTRTVNFFVRDRDVFKWPKRRDIEQIHISRLIYGPIEIEGHDPFTLDVTPIDVTFRKTDIHFPDGLPRWVNECWRYCCILRHLVLSVELTCPLSLTDII